MSGATPRAVGPGSRSRSGAWALAGGVIAALMIMLGLRLGQGGRRSPEPLEQVGRDRLVLREGRWMKTDETNAFTGWMVDFYPDGSLQSRSAVSNGVLSGPSEGWWTNGVKAILEQFQDGRSHGVRTKWDIAGHRIAETEIRSGQIHGWHREWHTNGKPSLEVTMARGKAHGLARKWGLQGQLAGQWVMSNGAVVQAITNATELGVLTQKGGRP